MPLMRRFNHKTLAFALTFGLMSSISHAASMTDAAIAERIGKVGSVYLAGEEPQPVIAQPTGPRTGLTVFNNYCMACHGTGAAGAPKAGDKASWQPRIAKGRETLNNHLLNGFNAMPAKGTCMDCSNDELIAALDHMLSLAN